MVTQGLTQKGETVELLLNNEEIAAWLREERETDG